MHACVCVSVCMSVCLCICMYVRTYFCVNVCISVWKWKLHIYIYVVVDQNSFIPERPFFAYKKFYFRETFANSMFIFRGAHVGQQHLL